MTEITECDWTISKFKKDFANSQNVKITLETYLPSFEYYMIYLVKDNADCSNPRHL